DMTASDEILQGYPGISRGASQISARAVTRPQKNPYPEERPGRPRLDCRGVISAAWWERVLCLQPPFETPRCAWLLRVRMGNWRRGRVSFLNRAGSRRFGAFRASDARQRLQRLPPARPLDPYV